MADDGHITIYRTTNLSDGELMTELFRRQAIPARFRRVSAALIGVGPQIFETRVDVPVESEARARELLSELEFLGASSESESEAESDAQLESEPESEPAPPEAGPPRRRLLGGVAFIVPGGGHFNARRPWTGLVLAVAILVCYVGALSTAAGGAKSQAEFGFGTFIALFLCDAIGGVRALGAHNRGIKSQPSEQVFRGLILGLIAIAAGAAFALAAYSPRFLLARRLERFHVSATPGGLLIENRDRGGRTADISRIQVRIGNSIWGRVFDVEVEEGESGWQAPPGGEATIEFAVPDEIRKACDGFRPAGDRLVAPAADGSYPAELCTIVFALHAADPVDPTSLIEGDGSCPLRWDGGPEGVMCDIIPRESTRAGGGE